MDFESKVQPRSGCHGKNMHFVFGKAEQRKKIFLDLWIYRAGILLNKYARL